jgi:VWFA-related protein
MTRSRSPHRFLPLLSLLLTGLVPVFAQQTPPASAPEPPAAPTQPAAPEAQGTPQATFGEVVKATAVTVTIDVRDASGNVPADLTAKDFEVLEDGHSMPVLSVEPIDTGLPAALEAASATTPPAAEGAAATVAPNAPESAQTEPAAEVAEPAAEIPEPWQIVVYLDLPTASTPTVQGAARQLAERADELVRLGTVEIVRADPSPEMVLPPTRDAATLRAALQQVSDKGLGRNMVAKLRKQFVAASDTDNLDELSGRSRSPDAQPRRQNGPGGNTGTPGGGVLYRNDSARGANTQLSSGASGAQREMLIRNAAQQEFALLSRQRSVLVDWLALVERPRRPHALVLVSDGFDVDPSEFYVSYLRDTTLVSGLQADLRPLNSGAPFEEMSKMVAASGWQVVAISLSQPGAQAATDASQVGRGRFRGFTGDTRNAATGSGLSSFLLRAPIDPLRTVADVTGGEVALTPKQVDAAMTSLGERLRLTYQVPRDPDGQLHQLEIRTKRAGLTVRAPKSMAAAAPNALMAARARHVLTTGTAEGSSLPVVATATIQDDPKLPQAALLTLDYTVELGSVAAERARLNAGDLRVTLVVELPDGRILVSQERPTARDLSSDHKFVAREPLRIPKGTKKVAVTVDDVATGAWGGAAVEPKS